MIQSMTGFGRATATHNDTAITAQIRSLNSKQNDLSVRMPSVYKEKEVALRADLGKRLQRGKIELVIQLEYNGSDPRQSLNTQLAASYYASMKELAGKIDVPLGDDVMSTLVRLPDVLQSDKRELDDEEWAAIRNTVNEAVERIVDFRKTEGQALENDLSARIQSIGQLLKEIEPFEEARTAAVRERLMANLADNSLEDKVDQNRFEQEIIYYLEKLDITEEKVRLSQHLTYFAEVMSGKDGQGKKLGFIAQEIGREINTIGSKANNADIQRLVVQMKDELEKIKEQVLNVL